MTDVEAMDALPVAARWIGRSVDRKEDRRLLTGKGLFVDDLKLSGMVHVAFVRSFVARGQIVSIDVSAAAGVEGVVAVYVGEQLNPQAGPAWHAMLGGEAGPRTPPPLAHDCVRHVGEPVAMVLASSRAIAEDAAELVDLEIDVEDPVVDFRTAADVDTLVHPEMGSNVLRRTQLGKDDPVVAQRLADARWRIETVVEQNRYVAAPMECRGIVADHDVDRGEIDLILSNQSAHGTRSFFARYLGLPESRVRVRTPDVGGAFGQKMFVLREECAVALASALVRRPVKWIEDRQENLLSAPHSRNEWARIEIAMDEVGRIEAIDADHVSDLGAYPAVPSGMDPALLSGPYKIEHVAVTSRLVHTNTVGRGAYRAPWMFETTAREVAVDIAARDAGLDPAAVRRRNLLTQSDLPFEMPGGYRLQEITPAETYEAVLDAIGYERFREEQPQRVAGGELVGIGTACYVEPTAKGSGDTGTEGALVRLEPDGRITVFVGTSAHGQSIETTMAQLAAERLGVDYEAVDVVQGDSSTTPFGPGTGGSRTAVVTGGAVEAASEQLRKKLVSLAGHLLEAADEDIVLEDGRATVRGVPARDIAFAQLVTAAYSQATSMPAELDLLLEGASRFRPTSFPTWSNAAHACIVAIDDVSFVPRILRYVVSEDCGPLINPLVVDGQTHGGVAQGIGGALYENYVYDGDGNPLTTTFMDYLLPTASEVPRIEVHHMETPSTTNPGGFKGMGEGGAIGSPAAVANAVADALAHLGVRITKMPLGPGEIFDLIDGASRGAQS